MDMKRLSLDLGDNVTLKLVRIPAGEFVMGSPVGERYHVDDETQHRVTLTKGFYLGVTEVTQKQWQAVMGNHLSRFKGDDLPVETASWDEAMAFCQKLSEKEGRKHRLPTEAEWEYACRAGTTTAYYTGDTRRSLAEACWHTDNCDNRTHPVGQKKPNAWGLYDMHGNVWEWCSDWYADYPTGEVTDPTGPENGTSRVLRGGSWRDYPWYCRSGIRYGLTPAYRHHYIFIGFRVALDL